LLSVIDCYFFFFSPQPEDVGSKVLSPQLAAEGADVAEIKDNQQEQQHLAELETELGEYRQRTYPEVKVMKRNLNLNFKSIEQYRFLIRSDFLWARIYYFYEINLLFLDFIHFLRDLLIRICFTES
jgi:hypothetical protein